MKSDNWIIKQCTPPDYKAVNALGQTVELVTGYYDWRYYKDQHLDLVSTTEEDLKDWRPMISPFVKDSVSEVKGKKVLSYGTSSAGYDITPAPKFRIFSNVRSKTVDPLNFDPSVYTEVEGDEIFIPPNGFILGVSNERLIIPRDISVTVLTKSTYARCAVFCLCTPLEPAWEGHITLEFANFSPCPVKFYANQGCAQLQFNELDQPCKVSYADRKGKYMNQPLDIINSKG